MALSIFSFIQTVSCLLNVFNLSIINSFLLDEDLFIFNVEDFIFTLLEGFKSRIGLEYN